MSSNTFQPTLDYLPAESKGKRPQGIIKTIQTFFAAVRNGINAAHQYERLKAQGVPPQKAVEKVFRDNFENRD